MLIFIVNVSACCRDVYGNWNILTKSREVTVLVSNLNYVT